MNRRSQFKKIGLIGGVCGGVLVGFAATPLAASAQQGVGQQQPGIGQELRNPCPQIYYEPPFNTTTLVPAGCPPNAVSQQLGVDQQSAPPGITLGAPTQVAPQTVPQPGPQRPGVFNEPPFQSPGAVPGQPGLPGVQPSAPGTPGLAPGQLDQSRTPGMSPFGGAGTPPVTPPAGQISRPIQPPLPEEQAQAVAQVMPMEGLVDVRMVNNTNAMVTYQVVGETDQRTLMGGEVVVLRDLPLPTTITTVRQDQGLLNLMPMSTDQGTLEISLSESQELDEVQGVLRIQDDGQVFVN